MDIHFFEFPTAAEQGDDKTAAVTQQGHDNGARMERDMEMVSHPEHGKQDCHQNLLKQDAKAHAEQQGKAAEQDVFLQVQFCYCALFHAEQEVDAEFTASFSHHKAHHITDQPCRDPYDKYGGKYHKHFQHIFRIVVFSGFILKEQTVKGIHQCADQGHGEQIDQIVSGGTFHISESQFTEHRAIHLLSGKVRPEFPVRKIYGVFGRGSVHGIFFRPLKTGYGCSSWRKRRRGLPSGWLRRVFG